jgi:GH15 family glucan-1,4-alpha-glucosidase
MVILKYQFKVENIISKLENGETLYPKDFLYARYTLDGVDEKEEGWGNFQLDGYGTWLWGLANHIKLTGNTELILEYKESIDTTIKYISNLWHYPNYDIWEENCDKIHTSTLACLFGGLDAINNYMKDALIENLKNKIKSYILSNCIVNGHFVKYIGSPEVDSSLTWLGIPFNVVELNDSVFVNTIFKIEKDLVTRGGTHRYGTDTYYGGGEWLLLSSWLGWYHAKTGDTIKAIEYRKWVENQSDEFGNLPEQVGGHINNEVYYNSWVSKWGEIASPLLWSHAMYLILSDALKKINITN